MGHCKLKKKPQVRGGSMYDEVLEFKPQSICVNTMKVVIDNNPVLLAPIVKSIEFTGGCQGQGKTLNCLLKGLTIKQVITKLSGITCGNRGTSCADQLAKHLNEWLSTQLTVKLDNLNGCVFNCDHCDEQTFDKCTEKFNRKF